MRLIREISYRSHTAKVYRDNQWNDHIVKYYIDGVHLKDADSHHYEDKDDAVATAQAFVHTPR